MITSRASQLFSLKLRDVCALVTNNALPSALQRRSRSILIVGLVAEDAVAGHCDRRMRPCSLNSFALMLLPEATAVFSTQAPLAL